MDVYLPEAANSSEAPESSSFFQAVTWLVWTPNFEANSAVDRSPRAAARATLALNDVLELRRFLVIC
jgi:hypothetical protein